MIKSLLENINLASKYKCWWNLWCIRIG